MAESHYSKLDKKTQQRHFASEHGNGKGSHLRAQTNKTRSNYSSGYDNIKWSKK